MVHDLHEVLKPVEDMTMVEIRAELRAYIKGGLISIKLSGIGVTKKVLGAKIQELRDNFPNASKYYRYTYG